LQCFPGVTKCARGHRNVGRLRGECLSVALSFAVSSCMTPEQEVARKRRVISAARRLLSLETGLVTGSSRLRYALRYLGDQHEARFPTFGRFLDAIPNPTPLGELRLACADEYLLRTDADLAVVESEFRGSIMRECLAVLNEFDREGRRLRVGGRNDG
jgi:hypothetical protein